MSVLSPAAHLWLEISVFIGIVIADAAGLVPITQTIFLLMGCGSREEMITVPEASTCLGQIDPSDL